MVKTFVHLRAKKKDVPINITSKDKPEIDEKAEQKWQNILDISASLLDVPAGLIMRITKSSMQVYLKSNTENNPYQRFDSEKLGSGLYCESVVGELNSLEIPNATKDLAWKDNPDIDLNMIGYYGLPIKWPDDEVFGTICVLDSQTLKLTDKHKQLLHQFRDSIETDLENLLLISQLEIFSYTDVLTGLPNRRFMMQLAKESLENNKLDGIALIDINDFKMINDRFGHGVGDDVLKRFAKSFLDHQTSNFQVGRLGGDEFLAVFEGLSKAEVGKIFSTIAKEIQSDPWLKKYQLSFEVGLKMNNKHKDIEALYKAADKALRNHKGKLNY